MKSDEIKNITGSFLSSFFSILIGLIAQKLFLQILGTEYLGLNGLFDNILSMLSIVELGVGTAIIYNLYKPIVEKDTEQIKSLMLFYKKAYNIITLVIFVLGILVIPFLQYIVDFDKVTIDVNIKFVYFLFLLNVVASYILSYKRSILYASKKNYVVNLVHILYLIVANLSQLSILYFTKNYYAYLIIKISMTLMENVIISVAVNRRFKYLKLKDAKPLDKDIEADIFKKVKALFFHKIGGFIVLGTDNIIISKYLGIIVVGLYSNYYLIINSVIRLFSQIIVSLTPSIGHLLVRNDLDSNFSSFKKIRFMTFWIDTFVSVSVLVIMQSFICVWIGKKYLLDNIVLFVLVFNCFQSLFKNSFGVFKDAAGIYYEDRFVPLFEALINIVVSIILCKLIGLPGVFIGTIASSMIHWVYSFPVIVYKKLFNSSYSAYIRDTIGYFLLFTIIAGITYFIAYNINISNIWIKFICNVGIAAIVPNLILFIIFRKSDNFKYFLNIIINTVNGLKSKLAKN